MVFVISVNNPFSGMCLRLKISSSVKFIVIDLFVKFHILRKYVVPKPFYAIINLTQPNLEWPRLIFPKIWINVQSVPYEIYT